MDKKFDKDKLVVHSAVSGKKFRVVKMINPSQYEIEDLTTGEILLEPVEYLLDIIDSRDNLINYLLNEK
jgi:hypothetical protein